VSGSSCRHGALRFTDSPRTSRYAPAACTSRSKSGVRVLLRNRLTKLYYVGLNQLDVWYQRALDFGDVPGAAEFTLEEELPDMEIVLRYDSFDGGIALPVLAEWCLFDERVLRPVTSLEELRRRKRTREYETTDHLPLSKGRVR
jgi:hypothetical protein